MAGIQDIPHIIPEKWSAQWFRTFIAEVLAKLDTRNAIGVGVTIDSDGNSVATLDIGTSVSDAIDAHDALDTAHTAAFDAHVALSDPHSQYATDTDLSTHVSATTDVHSAADYAQTDANEAISGTWTFADTITLPKTSGKGIKVDTATPTYPWHDLLGAISIRGVGATDPSYNVYTGGIRGYHFDVNEEVFVEFHIPHDYVPGSNIYLHFHHSINGKTTAGVTGGTVTGGTVTWGAEVTYAKGHNQAAFITPITTTVASTTHAATLLQHYITEVQLSAASPSASQLDSDNLEVDGLILVRAYLSANGITVSSGATPAPFLHYVDIHYQSTNIGTKNKSPGFWT